MCIVRGATQITVCDVSRDAVREALSDEFGNHVAVVTVRGEGTLFICLDPSRTIEFQHRVDSALGWTEENCAGANRADAQLSQVPSDQNQGGS